MNTTHARSIPLQSGQALAVDRRWARLVLIEGEVLLQAPADWVGGTVVLAPPRRVVAPAALDCAEMSSIAAIGPAKLLIEEAESPLEKLRAAWNEIRFAWFRFPWLSR
jgi:hypothetical protein